MIRCVHGADGDMLYGSDGELIALDELAAIFEADNCPSLKNKPKIFILHCCRGEGEEPAHREGHGCGSKIHQKWYVHKMKCPSSYKYRLNAEGSYRSS